MGDEEEIRKKKMAEMEQSKKIEEQIKTAMRIALDDNALERMSNVKVANRELYVTAAQQMVMLYKKLGRKLTESEVVAVLRAIKDQTENETKITFQRK